MDQVPGRNRVFVCYARRDKKYLDELQTHLTPEARAGAVDLWDDTRTKAGETWREEIKHALVTAKVAICLASKHFRASKFITEHELPPLLEAATSRGLVILPVVVGPCNFEESQLAGVQAVNDPAKALTGLSPHQRDQIWVKVVRRTKEALSEVSGPTESLAAPTPVLKAAPQRTEKRLGGDLGIDELVAQGSSLNKAGRYFEATHPLEKALRQDGSHFRAWFEFAFALANSGSSDLVQARAAFMRAHDLAGQPPSDGSHHPTRIRQPNAEHVTLCTGTGSGLFYHNLGTQPDKALLVGVDGSRDVLVPDAVAVTTLHVTRMGHERWVAMVYTERHPYHYNPGVEE